MPTFGTTRLTLEDGTVLETPSSTVVLYRRDIVRERVERVVAPLRQEGIDRLKVVIPTDDGVEIEKEKCQPTRLRFCRILR